MTKNQKTLSIKVQRIDSSPYLSSHFIENEKRAIESLSLSPSPSLPQISLEYEFNQVIDGQKDSPLILITNTHSPLALNSFPKEILSKISLIIHPNSGYDNICSEFVRESNFPIIIGHEIRAQAVVEYILSALFMKHTVLPEENIWNKERKWSRSLLKHKKILIIGYGHIGKLLHQTLKPLCENIDIFDPPKKLSKVNFDKSHPYEIVILCPGLNPTSHMMIDDEKLSHFSPDFLLINPSRGQLINESDLIKTLELNPNAKVILDVHEKEPYDREKYSHLLKGQVTLTSHIAGVYEDLENEMILFETKILGDFLFNFKGNIKSSFLKKYHHINLKNRLYCRDQSSKEILL